MAHQSIIDKTSKIVFVNNIPLETTEEKLKDLFRKVGPVASFKIIYDKDTGKSKGCGICEYKDQETALSAVKALNDTEFGDRYLKVDHALNEKTRLEMISVMQNSGNSSGATEANSSSEKAPETISKAVASLPPEQMFELLKQMKQCIQNNQGEAKNMLIQNPQLAYALLQALVVMRIVDPQIAHTALSNSSTAAPGTSVVASSNSESHMSASTMINRISTPSTASMTNSSETRSLPNKSITNHNAPPSAPSITNSRTYTTSQPTPPVPPSIVPPAPVVLDTDMRSKAASAARPDQDKPKPFAQETSRRDPRLQHQQLAEPKDKQTPRTVPPPIVPAAPQVSVSAAPSAPTITSLPTRTPAPVTAPSATTSVSAATGAAKPASGTDNEKAALIMQVLRLTDAQIAMLPPEQRQSILLLKEQIAKSTKR